MINQQIRFRSHIAASLFFLTMTGCATPRAIRNLSQAQLAAQKSYAQSLRDYFKVIEAFADAQIQVANSQIDAAALKIDTTEKQIARQSIASATTDSDRQKALDQLVTATKNNHDTTAATKTGLADLVLKLKAKDAEMLKAYATIVDAQEKLDTYIQMKKADEAALDALTQAVGINQQKLEQDVSEIGDIVGQISKKAPAAR